MLNKILVLVNNVKILNIIRMFLLIVCPNKELAHLFGASGHKADNHDI
jgi:hypothetical protein